MQDAIDIIDKLIKNVYREKPSLLPHNIFQIVGNLRKTLESYSEYKRIYDTLRLLSERKGSIIYYKSSTEDGLSYRVKCGNITFNSVSLSGAIAALDKYFEKEKENA